MEGLDHDWVVTHQPDSRLSGRIDEEFLSRRVIDFSQRFYVCGPDQMVADLRATLAKLGADTDAVTFEK